MNRQKAERRGRVTKWIAMFYLMAKGYRILGHRCRTPHGEADIAAWKGGVLVIVEVKALFTFEAGMFAVRPMAQQRIARAAQTLAGRWRLHSAPIRLDVIVVGASVSPKHERAAWFDEPYR